MVGVLKAAAACFLLRQRADTIIAARPPARGAGEPHFTPHVLLPASILLLTLLLLSLLLVAFTGGIVRQAWGQDRSLCREVVLSCHMNGNEAMPCTCAGSHSQLIHTASSRRRGSRRHRKLCLCLCLCHCHCRHCRHLCHPATTLYVTPHHISTTSLPPPPGRQLSLLVLLQQRRCVVVVIVAAAVVATPPPHAPTPPAPRPSQLLLQLLLLAAGVRRFWRSYVDRHL